MTEGIDTKKMAVVVLNWNGLALLEQFLGNWEALTPDYAELIIVDNGSTDGSLDYVARTFPHVRCIAFTENYGFAEGYNRAIGMLQHDYIVLLNSDAALSEYSLDEPLKLLEGDNSVVAVQPKLRAFKAPQSFEYAGAAGGYVDALGYPYCAGRVFDAVEVDSNQYDEVRPLMWATGACLIVRRSAYLDAGGLDAEFFAHQEEIDLCWRMRARGGKILLAPSSIVYHVGGASLDAANPKKTYLNFRNNLLMLYKNLPALRLGITLFLRLFLDLIVLLRYVLGGQRQHAKAIAQAWKDALCRFSSFREKRCQNLKLAVVPASQILSPLSIVWHYFVLGHKKYSDLSSH